MIELGLIAIIIVVIAVVIAARKPFRLTCSEADCRADNDRDAKFCRRCGRKIEFSRFRSVAVAVSVIVTVVLVLWVMRFVMHAI